MMKIDGACYCGEISYEAEVDPERVFICNCTDCQRMTGSTMRVSRAAPEVVIPASFRGIWSPSWRAANHGLGVEIVEL